MKFDKNTKTRVWTFLVWPESAPERWQDRLQETRCPILISPLHDKDTWTALDEIDNPEHKEGQLKKPHHHCMLFLPGPARASQAKTALSPLKISYVEPVADVKMLTRYFCHLDNDEKAKYNLADMVSLNNAPIDTTLDLTPEQKREIRNQILTFIKEYNVTEYSELIYYCMENEPDWLDYAATHTIFLDKVISSGRYKALSKQQRENK